MMSQEFNRQNIFKEYPFIRRSIEDDLTDLVSTAFRIVNFGAQELLEKYASSLQKNSEIIEESIDVLYFDVKKAFKDAVRFTSRETYYNETRENSNENNSNKNKWAHREKNEQYEEAKIVYMLPEHTERKHSENNYTSLLENIISKSDSAIGEVATLMSGKFCDRCGVKDRKLKKMWRWEDRINYVKGLLSEKNISESEKEQIQELRVALQKNNYLKYKKPEYYRQLDECLKQYA